MGEAVDAPREAVKLFRLPLGVVAIAIALVAYWKPSLVGVVLILGLLEVSFSFDNAVVNAKILGRMSSRWQSVFLTVGVLIAVFGMRLLFPLIIVSLAGHLNPWQALHLAVTDPHRYQQILIGAHAAVISFGGIFLLMIFLDWLIDDREIRWLRALEVNLSRLGKIEHLSVVTALVVLVVFSELATPQDRVSVLVFGALGLATYLAVNAIGAYFEDTEDEYVRGHEPSGTTLAQAVTKAGLATFLYLEVLDASFSFDGVMAAFAVTTNILVIMIGLGIGALFVRTLTVYLVNNNTLQEYVHLEHGANWAIGTLAVISLFSIRYSVSEYVPGLIGVSFIAAAIVSSIVYRRRNRENPTPTTSHRLERR